MEIEFEKLDVSDLMVDAVYKGAGVCCFVHFYAGIGLARLFR